MLKSSLKTKNFTPKNYFSFKIFSVSDPSPSKEKKQRVRKRKAPAPKIPQPVSGLDLVQNFASINQKQEQGNNNIVNTTPVTTTNTNFIITPTSNNSLHNFFLSNQGQTIVQNQQVINFLIQKLEHLRPCNFRTWIIFRIPRMKNDVWCLCYF